MRKSRTLSITGFPAAVILVRAVRIIRTHYMRRSCIEYSYTLFVGTEIDDQIILLTSRIAGAIEGVTSAVIFAVCIQHAS